MALFGKGWRDGLATLGATLSDVGSALDHTEGGYLERLQARRRFDAERSPLQGTTTIGRNAILSAAPLVGAAFSSLPGYSLAAKASRTLPYGAREAPVNWQSYWSPDSDQLYDTTIKRHW